MDVENHSPDLIFNVGEKKAIPCMFIRQVMVFLVVSTQILSNMANQKASLA